MSLIELDRNSTPSHRGSEPHPSTGSTAVQRPPHDVLEAIQAREARRARLAATAAKTVARKARSWRGRVARWMALTDFVAITATVFGTQLLWFEPNESVFVREDSALPEFSYAIFSVLLVIAWMTALAVANSRDHRVIGGGADEFKRLFNASLTVFGVTAILAFVLRVDIARGYLMLSLPIGLALLFLGRWLWRRVLQNARRRGRAVQRTLVVGTEQQVATLIGEFDRNTWAGYQVVGVSLPGRSPIAHVEGAPVVGDFEHIHEAMQQHAIDTVVVASNDALSTRHLRELSWELDPSRHELVVAPGLLDVGGPRIHARPVAGLPLIHVEPVHYTRAQTIAKRTFDIVGSGLGLLVLAPVLLTLWVLVKVTSPGNALFLQRRVGHTGGLFTMYKFRTMVTNAEELLAELREQQRDAGNTVLFKLKDDPRVTRVGKFMRRYSLDELPQLVNVLLGHMSLVGPRPPIESELEKYEEHVHRRFLVKPGITGLWQVSGRSNLSWEDSVRLDLYYVENWSFVGDLVILWRTARAVVGRDGAY